MEGGSKRKRGKKSFLTESAKKRRKREQSRIYARGCVILGDQITRWKELKSAEGLQTDARVAEFLLNRYEEAKVSAQKTSTPRPASTIERTPQPSTSSGMMQKRFPVHVISMKADSPSVSEISAAGSAGETTESGLEPLPRTDTEDSENGKQRLQSTEKAGRTISKKPLSGSFLDPSNLSIDISFVQDESEKDDPDYEPSFDITACLPGELTDEAEEVGYEEHEFGMEVFTEDTEEIEEIEKKRG